MFWRRKREEKNEQKKKRAVKKIEGALWRYMFSVQGITDDILQNLRRVERDAVVGGKPLQLIMIRIFHPASAKEKGVTIDDYESLDTHPELVLYEGYYREIDGEATDIHIQKK